MRHRRNFKMENKFTEIKDIFALYQSPRITAGKMCIRKCLHILLYTRRRICSTVRRMRKLQEPVLKCFDHV